MYYPIRREGTPGSRQAHTDVPMRFGRLNVQSFEARGLTACGLHAFMLRLPMRVG